MICSKRSNDFKAILLLSASVVQLYLLYKREGLGNPSPSRQKQHQHTTLFIEVARLLYPCFFFSALDGGKLLIRKMNGSSAMMGSAA